MTAIIDGMGSLGAALGPTLTGYISSLPGGFDNVFLMLGFSALCAGRQGGLLAARMGGWGTARWGWERLRGLYKGNWRVRLYGVWGSNREGYRRILGSQPKTGLQFPPPSGQHSHPYLLRAAGSARGGGPAYSGQGYMHPYCPPCETAFKTGPVHAP